MSDLAATADRQAPPPVLLPYQQIWAADRAQLKLGVKSRRIGFTWAEAADDVLDAAAESGCDVFYITIAQDNAKEYIDYCAMWARAFNRAASEIGDGLYDDGLDANGQQRYIKTFEIRFPGSGKRIAALSSRPTNLRGKQGKIVIDEAAFAPDLAGLLKAALAMILWGDRVIIFSSQDGIENDFNQLVDEVLAGKRGGPEQASVHRVTFGQAVAEGLYKRVCLRKGIVWTPEGEAAWVAAAYRLYGDNATEELDCIPSNGGGKYLSLALIAQRMVPAWSPASPTGPGLVRGAWDDGFAYLSEDVRTYAIKGWCEAHLKPHLERLSPLQRHVFGQDFARSVDLSVITVAAEEHDLRHKVRLVVELRNCPFSCQEQILFYLVDWLKSCRFRGGTMDATGNGAALAEKAAQRYGTEMIEQVKLSAAWYLANMPKLKAGLQDDTLSDIPRDDSLRDDLRAITLVKGVPMVPHEATGSAAARAEAAESGAGKNGRRHGDFAVSLLMCEYSFHRECGEIAWTPAPGNARHDPDPGRRGFSMRPTDFDDDLAAGIGSGWKGAW